MSRHSILAVAWVAAALFIAVAPRLAAQEAGHGHAAAPSSPGHHPTPAEEAKSIANEALGADAGHKANPLQPELPLAFWTVVVFLGLLFVLGKFAWKPLLTALHAREEHLEHVLRETEKARNDSEALLTEHRRLMADASAQVKGLIEKARGDAQASADQIMKTAQAEAEASRDRAKREIGVAKDQALSEIWNKTADLAVSVAGKVLSKQIGDDDHRRLVDNAINELPQSPGSTTGSEGVHA